MQPDDEPRADVEIDASAAADELCFHAEPEVRVSFPELEHASPTRSLAEETSTRQCSRESGTAGSS